MSTLETNTENYILPQVLDLNFASELRSMLLDKLEKGVNTTIDASNVSRVTTPAVQILLAYSKAINSEGRKPTLHNPSEALKTAFRDLGLDAELSQWSTN